MPEKSAFPRFMLLLAAFVFLLVGIITAALMREGVYSQKDVRRFERTLHKKEQFLKDEFRELELLARSESPTELLDRKSDEYQELANSDGLYIFFYNRGVLVYWSDHTIPLPDEWRQRLTRPFLSLRNADYVTVTQPFGEGTIMSMIEIRTHYPFQNKFLNNTFQRDFKLDPAVHIEFFEAHGSEPVYNQAGDYLFSLNFTEAEPSFTGLRWLAMGSL